jgi:hypothetical protein
LGPEGAKIEENEVWRGRKSRKIFVWRVLVRAGQFTTRDDYLQPRRTIYNQRPQGGQFTTSDFILNLIKQCI